MERLALLGIPYDENSSFMRGAADAPPLIRAAFHSEAGNPWTEAGLDLGQPGLIFDAGDLDLIDFAPDQASREIESVVFGLLERGLSPVMLGGDHAITYPVLHAFHRKYGHLNLLHIDAHPDLYESFQDNPYSHASPFARIMEQGLVDRLVQVGIRTMTGHQREQATRFGVEVIEMKDWRDDLELRLDAPLYLSLDLDALDPAFAPGLSHREAGGFTTRQVIGIIQRLEAPLVGADIVEFNPVQDPSGLTAGVAAKLLKEIFSRMLSA